ncbi:TrkH family potassium uptake protein [Dermatophilus congolensis]|uniref:TrkH family potassium uptake protein n=1 Tax=Dermatophilus congolensis TaxID=1863 RepID=UPI00312C93F5
MPSQTRTPPHKSPTTTAPARKLRLRPGQAVVAGFAAAIAVGTALLMLPIAKTGPGGATFVEALFTATSAVCVTGLTVVDTATYWTPLGQVIIIALIQVGGLGIMTVASLLVALLSHRFALTTALNAAEETKALGPGQALAVVRRVVLYSLAFETITALALTGRFILHYHQTPGLALWHGTFHAISAFNNAGFALWTDNLMHFVTDPWICLPIAAAIIVGGIGFPVLFELRHTWNKPNRWTVHTRIALYATAAFLIIGWIAICALEWTNPHTMGPLDTKGKLLSGFFQSVMPRTAGFNSLDYSTMHPQTWLVTDMLMFVGGSSAGTAGGIKVTTFSVLAFVILAEIRGEPSVRVYNRRLGHGIQRAAITVVLLSALLVITATTVFIICTEYSLDRSLFEVISAFATVGLTTGITPTLPTPERLILVALMFIGRLGPTTFASALALQQRRRVYELPEERPIIG